MVLALASRLEKLTYSNARVRQQLLDCGCLEAAVECVHANANASAANASGVAGKGKTNGGAKGLVLQPLYGLVRTHDRYF